MRKEYFPHFTDKRVSIWRVSKTSGEDIPLETQLGPVHKARPRHGRPGFSTADRVRAARLPRREWANGRGGEPGSCVPGKSCEHRGTRTLGKGPGPREGHVTMVRSQPHRGALFRTLLCPPARCLSQDKRRYLYTAVPRLPRLPPGFLVKHRGTCEWKSYLKFINTHC